jgi:hypothetical protein
MVTYGNPRIIFDRQLRIPFLRFAFRKTFSPKISFFASCSAAVGVLTSIVLSRGRPKFKARLARADSGPRSPLKK